MKYDGPWSCWWHGAEQVVEEREYWNMTATVKNNMFVNKSLFLLVTSDLPSCLIAITAWTLLEALHRELHTRNSPGSRDLLLPEVLKIFRRGSEMLPSWLLAFTEGLCWSSSLGTLLSLVTEDLLLPAVMKISWGCKESWRVFIGIIFFRSYYCSPARLSGLVEEMSGVVKHMMKHLIWQLIQSKFRLV